ncbi:MAG: PAS domain S-box protein, partial [Nitrospirae bacterium]
DNLEDFISILKSYSDPEEYIIYVTRQGKEVFSCCRLPEDIVVKGDYIYQNNNPVGIYLKIPDKSLEVFLIKHLKIEPIYRELNAIVSTFSIAFIGMLLGFVLLTRKNLIEPIKKVMRSIQKGECAQPTGVKEIDDMVEVVNDALASLELENIEKETLYKIAVDLSQPVSFEETIDRILNRARVLLEAEYAALALYDETGKISWLRASGPVVPTVEEIGRMPEGSGVLELMRLSLKPVRIKDIQEHEAFSGAFPKGHPIVRSFLGYPLFGRHGNPIGAIYFANKRTGEFTEEDEDILIAIASNIAIAVERDREEKEIRRFKEIIDTSFDCIIITDQKGRITYVNRAFEVLTGYKKEEILGKTPSVLKSGLHTKDFYSNLWRTILAGRPWRGELINARKDGSLYTVSTVIFPVSNERGEIENFVAVQRDITEEKKLYEQLLRAQKMEAIGTLAGGIAHDFKNLMTVILGYTEVMKDYIKPEDTLWRQVEIIEKTAQRGASLASKILSVTKKESLEMKVVDVNRIVRETLEILERSIPKEIEIKVSLEEDLPSVKADPSQLQQVLLNLAINAKEAMPEGGTLYIGTSSVGKENGASNGLRGEGFVRITVEDTGRGIAKELQSRIFDPFFTTKKGSGTGLGLYIVHSIISAHNGYINLYSEPGKGTKFNIYIPVFKGTPEEEKEVDLESLKGSGTVLVVDDEVDILNLVEDLLKPLGYKTLKAKDGYEALEILRSKRDEIDLVLLDMVMPKLSGREVFQQIKNMAPEMPVVLCSGYTADGLAGVRDLIKEGAKAFVQKPFTRASLGVTLKRVISRSRQ